MRVIPAVCAVFQVAASFGDGAAEAQEFLTHLAAELNASVSIQNQALNALGFLYREC